MVIDGIYLVRHRLNAGREDGVEFWLSCERDSEGLTMNVIGKQDTHSPKLSHVLHSIITPKIF